MGLGWGAGSWGLVRVLRMLHLGLGVLGQQGAQRFGGGSRAVGADLHQAAPFEHGAGLGVQA